MPDPVEPIAAPVVETPAAPVSTPVATKPAAEAPKYQNDYAAELAATIAQTQAVLSAKDEPAPVATEPEPEVVTEPEIAADPETTEEVAPVTEPVVEPPKVEVTEGSDRIRFKDEQDAKIARLKRDHPEMSFAECEQFIKGKQAPAEQAVETDPVSAELADVQAALDAHADAGDLPTPEIRKMQRRENELLAKIEAQKLVAPLIAKEQERESKAFDAERVASGKKAAILFPEAYKDGSELHAMVVARKNEMTSFDHPDNHLFSRSDLPEILVGKIAVEYADLVSKRDGIPFGDAYAALKGNLISVQPEKSAAQTTKQVPPVPAARKPAVTAPGNAATRTPDRPKTAAEVQAELDAMNPEERFIAMFGRPA